MKTGYALELSRVYVVFKVPWNERDYVIRNSSFSVTYWRVQSNITNWPRYIFENILIILAQLRAKQLQYNLIWTFNPEKSCWSTFF